MFCKNCGDVLTDTEVVCRSCGFAIGTGANYCEQCGAETPSYAVVCELCGKEIVKEPEDDTPAAMQYAQEPTYGGYAQAYQQPQSQQQDFQTYTPNYSAERQNQASTEGIWMENSQNQNARRGTGATKSKTAVALLGFFLGMFGVHDLYLNKKGSALVHFLLSCIGLGFISWLWAIAELISCFRDSDARDGNGNLLE